MSLYINRTLCEVLDEMRKCFETRNFCGLNGLIEEAQGMGNKMEASLADKGDTDRWKKERKEAYESHQKQVRESAKLVKQIEVQREMLADLRAANKELQEDNDE